ncbi:MAG: hypothetical protein ACLVKI_08490 [Gordonibacter urolithinfaciens]
MSAGDPILIMKLNPETEEFEPYCRAHIIDENKARSDESTEGRGQSTMAVISFRLRWSRMLAPIEFAMEEYRLVWRGHEFDIQGFDDFMHQHRKIKITGVGR